jgi:hypothetical protein
MRHPGLPFAVLAAATLSCSGGPQGPHAVGEESFLSPEPGSGGRLASADGSPGSPAPAGAAAGAPAVEEADIYRLDGERLLVLNAYRGLQILDLTEPANPALRSRVPLEGTPVDLYLRGSVAFVAVSDVFDFAPVAGDRPALWPRTGSELWAIDVESSLVPVVLSRLPIEGQLEETRIVGDVLYAISRRTPWYGAMPAGAGAAFPGVAGATAASSDADLVYVASFDVANPADPRPVDRLDFAAAGWSTHANVTAERITLSQSGWDVAGPVTWFRAIDVADRGGKLALGAAWSCAGTVRDRWGMDFEPGTGLFRAVVDAGWNAGAALEVWTTPAPEAVLPVSRLLVDGSAGESLTAARFDGTRAYVVTAARVDPLFVVDTSDPANPKQAGVPLEMPGQLDFVEPRGERLLALGHTNEAGKPFQLQVSLVGVADPAAPALLSRAIFGSDWGWVPAQADDLRKAFQVIDPAQGRTGLVVVPVQGWDQANWTWRGGTQLVDWAGDALAVRGYLEHPGAIARAFPLDPSAVLLGALSDQAFQVVDAADRSAPAELARLDLARPVHALAFVRGKAVELSGDWYRGATELAVTEARDPDAALPLARVVVAAPMARMFQDGDVVWLLAQDWATGTAWLQAVDLSDPVHPLLRGRLDLAPEEAGGYGYGGYWGWGDQALLVGHVLALHRAYWLLPLASGAPGCAGCGNSSDVVRLFDLSDPDHPVRAGGVAIPGSAWSWGLVASGSFLWLTHYEWESQPATVRYYVDRIDVSDPYQPALLPKLNVPGVFFAASEDGTRLWTEEPVPPADWTGDATTWVHALEITGHGTARLLESASVVGWPGGSAVHGGYAWIQTWAWGGGKSAARLAALRLDPLSAASVQEIQSQWAWILKATGKKLFLAAGWTDQGILVYGLGDPGRPAFERFFRTQGWVEDVVVEGGIAYLPSGVYGVPMVPLAP